MTDVGETIVAEIKLKRKKKFFVLSYRSPSKSSAIEEENYCKKMQTLLDNINKEKPSAVILTGDFNARSPLFWQGETHENSFGKNSAILCYLTKWNRLFMNLHTFRVRILKLALT